VRPMRAPRCFGSAAMMMRVSAAVSIRADLRSGKAGILKLALMHGVGVGTVQRIKAGLNA